MSTTAIESLPVAGLDLTDLTDQWHDWPDWSQRAIVRRLDATRWVAIVPMIFTWAVIVGDINCWGFYNDRWCYHSVYTAVAAATAWTGTGEPDGWHRHPMSGRRRDAEGNEWVQP